MSASRVGQTEIVVLFTAFIATAYGFGIYLFPALVESIRRDLDFSYATLGLITGLVQAGFLVSSALAGLLTLRFGAIPLILGSILACAIALAGLAFAQSILVLAGLLIVLGAAASLIWVPMVEVSRLIIEPRHRGKALGLMSSGTSYGVFINSLLLASVLPVLEWRALWMITAGVAGALAIYAFIRLAPLSRAARTEASTAGAPRTGFWARAAALPKGLVGLILFMMFLNGFSCMPFQTYLSAYLIGEMGVADTRAASAWGLIGLVGMGSGVLMGAVADRITIRRGLIVTYVVLSIAVAALLTVSVGDIADPSVQLGLVTLASVAFGLSFYAIYGLVPAYISHRFGDGTAALVFAFGNVAAGLGGMAGNLAGGFGKDLLGSFDVIYAVILVAALASVVIAAVLPSEVEAASAPVAT